MRLPNVDSYICKLAVQDASEVCVLQSSLAQAVAAYGRACFEE